MHDSVPYLRNNLPDETDILHEYFVPRSEIVLVHRRHAQGADRQQDAIWSTLRSASCIAEHNSLTYAPEPAFSVVLYINQTTDADGNRRMRRLTGDLIDLTIAHGGRFFLPYQLYYSTDQLQRSYPQINDFFAAKRKCDPGGLFTNTFYQKYAS